jgi:hypothetical protein
VIATRPRRPRAGSRRLLRAALLVLGGALLFALGVAVGEALHESSREPGTRTEVRTLRPGTVAPPRRTVTLTVTAEG